MKSTLKLKIIIFITFCMVTFVACRDDVSNESPALPSISSNTVSNDVQSDFVFILNNAGTEYGISAKENIKLKGEITIPAIYNAKPVTKIFNFTGQQEITRVVMSDNIREIDAGAFLYCTNLESIIFSNNLEIIDKSAFYTTGLISVTIPASVTTIGYMAFGNCNNLIDIEIFANEVNIGKEAFQACTKLTGITFENSTASIGEDAFRDCIKLENISFGNNLVAIGKSAFSGCSLLSLTIPSSVISIGADAFRGCNAKYINVKGYTSKPDGWHKDWNFYEYGGHSGINEIYFPVNWGYKGSEK